MYRTLLKFDFFAVLVCYFVFRLFVNCNVMTRSFENKRFSRNNSYVKYKIQYEIEVYKYVRSSRVLIGY